MRILLVEDDLAMATALCRTVRTIVEIDHCPTIAEGRRAVEEGSYCAMITDLQLPDGEGFDIIRFVRDRDRNMPILLLTGVFDRDVVERAFSLGATYLNKPIAPKSLLAFVRKALATTSHLNQSLDALGVAWESRYALTPTETDVLVALAKGMSREEFGSSRAMPLPLLERHVTHLISKLGERTMDAAALRFVREALEASRAAS